MVTAARQNSSPFDQTIHSEKIRDPQRIAALLKLAKDSRVLISISIGGISGRFTSAIIKVDNAANYLWLDELQPGMGNQELLRQRQFKVQLRLNGIFMSFSATVDDVGSESGIAYYKLDFPKLVDYWQRRAAYRVRLFVPVNVDVETSDGQQFSGTIIDLSTLGLALAIPDHFPFKFAHGELIPTCRFQLLEDDVIDCQLTMRSYLYNKFNHKHRVGCQFVKISKPNQRRIARYVANTERQRRNCTVVNGGG